MGSNSQHTDYDYADGVVFHVFALEPGKTAEARICNTKGETEAEIRLSRQENRVSLTRQGPAKLWQLCLRGIHRYAALENVRGEDSPLGLLLSPEPDTTEFSAHL
jgi:alpha-D-xyloside xylohydrolase